MRHKTFLVLLLSFGTLHSKPQTAQQLSKAAIEVGGAKLRLGMSKSQVTEKLKGNDITKFNEDWWALGSLEKKTLGGNTIQFTNGMLSFAEREWTTSDNDVGEALFGVVTALNNEGFSDCSVTANTDDLPDLKKQLVWISCGQEGVLVARRSFGGRSGTSVYETLGHARDTTE